MKQTEFDAESGICQFLVHLSPDCTMQKYIEVKLAAGQACYVARNCVLQPFLNRHRCHCKRVVTESACLSLVFFQANLVVNNKLKARS